MAQIHRCPKCDARFNPPRDEVSECPQCGIWFHKWNDSPVVLDAVTESTPDEVLQAEPLRQVFGLDVLIQRHPERGHPLIIAR